MAEGSNPGRRIAETAHQDCNANGPGCETAGRADPTLHNGNGIEQL